MNPPTALFKIISQDDCPMYDTGDEFELREIRLKLPPDKPACLTLIGDIEIFMKCEGMEDSLMGAESGDMLDCSGCTGKIRLEYQSIKAGESRVVRTRNGKDISSTVQILTRFPFFQVLDEMNIKDLVSSLKMNKYDAGDTVIEKGEQGRRLFIIVSGKVEVVGSAGVNIAFLGVGEIFGEMSLLSGDPVGATIRVAEAAKILSLDGNYFRKILNKKPALQMYISRLLARRLAKTNVVLSEEFSSGMVGRLSEMLPSVLFQTFNLNQKSGMLDFELSKGEARVCFRDGELVGAVYNNKKGRDAFFEILRETDGRFRFDTELPPEKREAPPIGDFMAVLMEGIKRIDESE